ncbi:GNAT family N-acetyltransferase [Nocardia transvalensis]|uniref:GNAT family N-acetyltransferase n=1 Tax=Nocardia transvalensis TaxID=37333 RepID=UPI00189552CC|nr:GNAT family N-acetyltransferase [Nocardia transvalensis]MBF6331335.1 acetyltransferase [Nocardia transvalensis]
MTGTRTPQFTCRRLTTEDFPMLGEWLAQPHVRRWWNHEFTPEAIERDFGPSARGEDPSEDLLIYADGEPVGLVQRCRLHDFPEYVAELTPLIEVPAEAMSIDYLVGDPQLVGRGLGSAMIGAVIAGTWADHPRADCVIVPVTAANRASWRALENAGLRRIAEGPLTPDNPADDGHHFIYRIDR